MPSRMNRLRSLRYRFKSSPRGKTLCCRHGAEGRGVRGFALCRYRLGKHCKRLDLPPVLIHRDLASWVLSWRHPIWRSGTGRHTGKGILRCGIKRPDATSVLRAARIGRAAFYRWHRKEKEAIEAGKASLTLVPVNVGMSPTGNVIRFHSPGGWRIELPAGEAPWLGVNGTPNFPSVVIQISSPC